VDTGKKLPELVAVMRRLLGPEGCPWDRAQTLESLRPFVIEEAFEVVDAIDRGEASALKEELGDLLFQVVFQSEIAAAKGWFQLDDVVDAICKKMVRRHPWVFGDAPKEDGLSSARWEAMKAKEKRSSGVLGGVPLALPALLRATRVSEKAAAVGFDWQDASGARAKIDEELREVDEATTEAELEHEIGDLLFAVTSFSRHRGIDPEAALRGTIERFSRRFRAMELAVEARGETLKELDDAGLDREWTAAKQKVG
jgi:nucleoside triphosphate diphosphatase